MSAAYKTRMLYADSRLELSRSLEYYLTELRNAAPEGEEIRLITCTPIPVGKSAEGSMAIHPLGLLVVTLQSGEGD